GAIRESESSLFNRLRRHFRFSSSDPLAERADSPSGDRRFSPWRSGSRRKDRVFSIQQKWYCGLSHLSRICSREPFRRSGKIRFANGLYQRLLGLTGSPPPPRSRAVPLPRCAGEERAAAPVLPCEAGEGDRPKAGGGEFAGSTESQLRGRWY